MAVKGIDHVALPTANAERFVAWYEKLGFGTEHVDEWRAGRYPIFSITCGDQKINVHPEALEAIRGRPEYLRGPTAEAGCGDLCFSWDGGVDALLTILTEQEVEVISGPVVRIGGRGGGSAEGISVYVRDPDENLVEFISYDPADFERYGGERDMG